MPGKPAANPNEWENDQKPTNIGGMLMCPQCGSEITGPYSAVMANNRVVQKTGCTRCPYVWKITGGPFKTAFEANPVAFG